MKKIIVLDNSNSQTYVFDFDENKYDANEIQNFFADMNDKHDLFMKESQCSWMITNENNLSIEFY